MMKKKRKMTLETDHCENSEICCTLKDFLILKELQSPFTYKLQTKSWTETMLRAWSAQMNLVVYICKDEVKRENLSLSITLNHNPRCNISSFCDMSVNLICNNALWRLTLSLSAIYEQNTVRCTFVFRPATNSPKNPGYYISVKIYINIAYFCCNLWFSKSTP